MHGWLIYASEDIERNRSYIDWFIKEGALQGVKIELVPREQLTIGLTNNESTIVRDNNQMNLPQFTIIRTIEPILQYAFQQNGVKTFNSFTIASLTNDKSQTYMEVAKLGIPILQTFFITKNTFPTTPPLAYPFVVKEANGRSGKQVYYIENENEWLKLSDIVTERNIIIQEANVQLGKDLRVFIVGKEIIAAVLRENVHDFRANYTLGGSATLFSLSTKQKGLIQKIVDHFDFGMVGIDFLLDDNNELVFNEIEDVVGSRILSLVSEINLLRKYVSFIKETMPNDTCVSEFHNS